MSTLTSLRLGLATSLIVTVSACGDDAAPSGDAGSTSTPVLLVHGYNSDAVDCRDPVMSAWADGLTDRALSVRTVGFYAGDTNCDLSVDGIEQNDQATDLGDIAAQLSQLIASEYGTNPVLVVGHSMGGLIVRRMITGIERAEPGFAPIVVPSAITAATPHGGAGSADPPATPESHLDQMDPDSFFRSSLGDAPETEGGTTWTLLASECDEIVDSESATAMNGPNVTIVRYSAEDGCGGSDAMLHTEVVMADQALDDMAAALATT
jgi:pimeloyl-ACP methyl ester carboxylesterase